MKKIFFLTILFLLNSNFYSLAENKNCSEFNKFSVEYLKCKGKLIKDKNIQDRKYQYKIDKKLVVQGQTHGSVIPS